jgi:WD40 repeat protein
MKKCRASEQFFAFMILDTVDDKDQLIVYLYDMMQNKYLGHINLHAVIGLKTLNVNHIDFIFSSASSKGSLTVYYKDTLFLIAESSREGLKGQWTVVKK